MSSRAETQHRTWPATPWRAEVASHRARRANRRLPQVSRTGALLQRLSQGQGLLPLALGLAIVLRLLLLLTLQGEQGSDSQWYLDRARELVATGRYAEGSIPTAFWPVGYPAFLGALMLLFGTDAIVGQVANAVLGVVAVWLLHRWCWLQFGSARVAGLAALFLAVYPNHLGYTLALYSEPLYTALLLAMLVVARCPWGVWRWLSLGLLAGAATLVKSQTLLLAPLLLLLLVLPHWRREAIGRRWPAWLLSLLVMACVVAPWTWRNHVVMGAAVPVSTNAGMSLLIANNERMRWGQAADYEHSGPVFDELRFSVADQVAADQRARALAWRWISEHPGDFMALMPWKIYRQWAYDGESEWWFQRGFAAYEEHWLIFRSLRWLNQLYYLSLLTLGLWGLVQALRLPRSPAGRGPRAWVAPLLLLFFTALAAVFSGQARYHYPLMPLIFGYAAWGFMLLGRRGRDRGKRAPVAAA